MSKKIQDNENFKEFVDVLEHCLKDESELVVSNFMTRLTSFFEQKLNEIVKCESPIEKALYLSLDEIKDYNEQYGTETVIFKQQDVEVDGNNYRVDFVVVCKPKNGGNFGIVIECDGHDFHEKTKEQAQRDKKRDRDLLKRGLIVMRFTGSEIYNDADSCAWEVINLIESKVANKKIVRNEVNRLFN